VADDTPKPAAPLGSARGGETAARSPARRRGRRIANVVYYSLAACLGVSATIQLTRQLFFPTAPAAPPPFRSCAEGLRMLYDAIDRGRRQAEGPGALGEDDDEDAALLRYREALAPSWRHRDQVAAMCHGDARYQGALDAIERLRYSEEHGVRHQAIELTLLRRRVRQLVEQRLAPTPTARPER
jgi:hypothetical protein